MRKLNGTNLQRTEVILKIVTGYKERSKQNRTNFVQKCKSNEIQTKQNIKQNKIHMQLYFK